MNGIFDDIIGKKFGKLTVISVYDDIIGIYNCKCDCGNTCLKSRKALDSGLNLSCGCDFEKTNPSIITAKEKALNSAEGIIGRKFERLTPIAIDHIKVDKYNRTHYFMRCKCDCGREKVVDKIYLITGSVKSCGCLHNNLSNVDKEFVQSYHAMKERCKNPSNDHYRYYGARGITYDPSWEYFNNFKDDMYDKYVYAKDFYKTTVTIDRIDVNGNYNKDNCRWVTIREQANNKTNNRRFTFGESKFTASELVDKFADPGLDYEKLRNRLRNSTKYAVNDVIINTNVFINEDYRKDKYKPIRFN